MTAVVDICNMALSHLGDEATLISIEPPEGSPQADHCARFYPLARDTMLASHSWGFATKTSSLARSMNTYVGWDYAYVLPSETLSLLQIFSDNIEVSEFSRETDGNGNEILLCNYLNIVARYTYRVTNPTLFPPLFVQALSWQLASLLSGPMIKGASGAQESQRCSVMAMSLLEQAKAMDSRQRADKQTYIAPWIEARRGDTSYGKY